MSLRIQLLGKPRLQRDGHPIDLPGHRPLALLAYLILTRKAHHREHLIDLFFDGPDDPRAALRWTLSKIRKAVGDHYLLADRDEVAFNLESDYWLDVTDFEAGEVELYQGDLLEGFYLRDALRFEEWLLFERQRLRGQYQLELEKQLAGSRRLGDSAAVVITGQKLLKLDNLREDWHLAMMEAYARLGKRGTALEQFEQCRQALRIEWNTDPAPETLALAEAIRNGEIGPQVSLLERGTSQPLNPTEQFIAPAGSQQTRPRPSLPRPVWALIGVLGLVAIFLLVWSRVANLNNQTAPDDSGQSSIESIAVQPALAAQALAGKTVWILGPFQDLQTRLFKQSMLPFEQSSGIHIVFLTGDETYDLDLATRLETGDLPDIIVFSQPGWLATLAEQDKIVDLGLFLEDDYLRQQYPDTFLDLVTVDGQRLGVWHTVDLKSLVWYPKKAFEAKGYQVPETWDELIALSDQIVADGGVPWCIGIESAEATGWVGTDWVEDILLRTAPPETYDAWVRHELPFNSPEIRRVFEIMGQIWLNDDYVYGGTANIAAESIFDSPTHLLDDPPSCYLHRQATFARYFFPPQAVHGEDYDFFYLPPIDPQYGNPVLGSGVLFAMVNDRPEVREVMRYLTTAESTKELIKNGSFLSPHLDTPIEWFPTAADLRLAQMVLSADAYRFDGSDLMPAEVGLGSFYRGITDWVQGADLDVVLQEIDKSWPR